VICGLVTPALAETGKSVMNSAVLLQDGKQAFLQSKMLLPTYDVFDEMRNFAPSRHQELFDFCRQPMALTICERPWNDKHFWNNVFTVDPVDVWSRPRKFRADILRRRSGCASANCGAHAGHDPAHR